jgi:aminoglycoside/choline kinase family phosphotransferase
MQTHKLTPAQKAFLGKHIPRYVPGDWSHSVAGFAGSERKFLRIQRPGVGSFDSYVLIIWDSADNDWDRFLDIQKDFAPHTTLLPRIYASDPKHGLILEEDLGADTLKAVLALPGEADTWYRRVIDALVEWHALDPTHSATIRARAMDEEMFLWETDYFALHCVTEYCGRERMLTPDWQSERLRLAREVRGLAQVCMHRDFQSENIMIVGDRIRFIDFQGSRLGPAEYDLASLLFDPYCAVLDSDAVNRLMACYRERSGRPVTTASFHQAAMQRLMQALGAFGNLSIHKGKEWYRAYIPRALKRLSEICEQEPSYPAIHAVVRECLKSVSDQ